MLQQPTPPSSKASTFTPQPVMNDHEEKILKIVEMVFGDDYRVNTQTPLAQICSRNEWLELDWYVFHTNSTLDLVVIQKNRFGKKYPSLAIECQSEYHDSPDAKVRDQRKQYILDAIGLPLVQVRYLGSGGYHFYSHRTSNEVFYDSVNLEGLTELKDFLFVMANIPSHVIAVA